MSGKSVQEEAADAALVNKFRDELDDPKSSLLEKLTSSELATGDIPKRDAATAEILKEHGYENLSPTKLSELVNPRPKDISQIQPPGQLVAPNDPTKPVLAFFHFAGQYKVTSAYHPEGAYKIIVQADPADKTKGIISWGQDRTHQQYEAKLVCSLKQDGSKETSEYWAVWGDVEGEHWNAQFFGPSETSSLASFVGFRRTKQRENTKDDAADAFHGSMTLLQGNSDASVFLKIVTLGFLATELAAAIFLVVRRIHRRINEANDPALAEPPPAEHPLDEERERERQERERQEREEQEREEQEREIQEREIQERERIRESLQAVVDAIKKAKIQDVASEVLKSPHPAKLALVENLETGVKEVFEKAYSGDAKPKYGEPLDNMTLLEIDSVRTRLIRKYAYDVLGKVREVVLAARDAGFKITTEQVFTEIQSHLEAATVERKGPFEYTDVFKGVIDRAHLSVELGDKEKDVLEKRKDGLNKFSTNVEKLERLQDLLQAQKREEAKAAYEADPRKKSQFEDNARQNEEKYREALKDLSDAKFDEMKKVEEHLENLQRLENEVRDHRVREMENTKSAEEHRKRVEHAFEGRRRGRP